MATEHAAPRRCTCKRVAGRGRGTTLVARGEPIRAYPGWDAERGVYVMCGDDEPSSSYADADVPAATPGANSVPVPGSAIGAQGEPLSAYPGWDATRGVFVLDGDRDPGSSYDDADVTPPLPGEESIERGGGARPPAVTGTAGARRARRRPATTRPRET